MTESRNTTPLSAALDSGGFIVRDQSGQKVAFVYFEDEPGRRAAAKLLTHDEARPIAVNIAELPELLRREGGCKLQAGSGVNVHERNTDLYRRDLDTHLCDHLHVIWLDAERTTAIAAAILSANSALEF